MFDFHVTIWHFPALFATFSSQTFFSRIIVCFMDGSTVEGSLRNLTLPEFWPRVTETIAIHCTLPAPMKLFAGPRTRVITSN
jgi:hypothetical protein